MAAQRDEFGQFLPGNKIWEARTSYGRELIFSTPEILKSACIEYFEYVHENPLLEEQLFAYQGAVTHEPVTKMRAMTKDGLYVFLGIGRSTWDLYCGREGYKDVTEWVEMVIRTQKFEGAAAGMLNPVIVARDIGLRESTSVEHSGGVSIGELSDSELESRIAQLIGKTGTS